MDICSVNSYRDDAPGSHYKPVIRHYPWVSPHYIRPLFIGACQVALIANSSMTADRTTGKWSAMSMAISQPGNTFYGPQVICLTHAVCMF